MKFFALLFHSSTKLTTEYEAARLERMREEQRWRQFDEPAWIRRRGLRERAQQIDFNTRRKAG